MDNTISLNEREKLLQQIDYLREPLRQLNATTTVTFLTSSFPL